jgi:hypothetical protein
MARVWRGGGEKEGGAWAFGGGARLTGPSPGWLSPLSWLKLLYFKRNTLLQFASISSLFFPGESDSIPKKPETTTSNFLPKF